MRGIIRWIMIVESTAFIVAALTHFGFLFRGYAHQKAAIAETVIAAVLVFGVVASGSRPARTYGVELLTQSFALVGTLVGIFTIIVGVGPRTVPDIIYHAAIVIVLATGIGLTMRARG
jgi:uncharacterized protein YqgC (DUF456 family)